MRFPFGEWRATLFIYSAAAAGFYSVLVPLAAAVIIHDALSIHAARRETPMRSGKLPLLKIHSSNSGATGFEGGVAEALHVVHVAELFADELAEDAVALAVQDAHLLDA